MDEETINQTLDGNKKYSEAKKVQALELISKMAFLVRDYDPDVTLLVLETAIEETIRAASPTIGDLFHKTMNEFKNKAALVLQLREVLGSLGEEESPE